MKSRIITTCTLIALFLSPLRAQDALMENKTKSDDLNWELSDVSMKKTATSMVMWGLSIIPIAIIVISLVVQPNPGDTSSDDTSTDDTSSDSSS